MDIMGIAIANQMDNRRDVLQYPDGPLSPKRPLTPAASGWDTDPSSLENCVDGDNTSKTGVGSTTVGGAAVYGYVSFDLESVRNVIITAKLEAHSSASTTTCYIENSVDGTTWYPVHANVIYATGTATSADVSYSTIVTSVHGRYFRIRFNVGGAATAYGTLYTVSAYDIGD